MADTMGAAELDAVGFLGGGGSEILSPLFFDPQMVIFCIFFCLERKKIFGATMEDLAWAVGAVALTGLFSGN